MDRQRRFFFCAYDDWKRTQHSCLVKLFSSLLQVGPTKHLLLGGSNNEYSDGIYSTVEYEDTTTDEDTNRSIGLQVFEVIIPNGYFSLGSLEIGFKAAVDNDGHFGIDNVVLATKCSDPNAGRMLEHVVKAAASMHMPPASEPALDGEDESYYCLAEDFRCEAPSSDDDNDKHDYVYVCHYSALQGYRTFCIPETDSEVLRFYGNDYCGPCVGGFAGVQVN